METLQPGSSSWAPSDDTPGAGPSQSGSGSVGPDRSSGLPTRKRKQNQACVACKSRKVRCDLIDLPAGSVCTPCVRKGINCVVHKLDGPRRLNKTGRRVEEAKRSLGSVDYSGATPPAVALAPPSTASVTPPSPPPQSTSITDAELDDILRALAPNGDDSSFAWRPPPPGAQQQQQQALPFSTPAALPVISLSSAAHQLQVKTLEATMEQDLLQTFFTKAHFAVQAVDPELFRTMYNAHLRNPTFMTPVNQTICAFMAAWGARYTTHPSILPPGLNVVDCGQAREGACRSLFLRAQDMMDAHGILRTPSAESVQCLILASQLSMYNEDLSSARGAATESPGGMDSIMMKGVLASHIQACGMWETAEEDYAFANLDETTVVLKVRQQRVLWTAWIGDAFWSLGYHGRPAFDDEAVFQIAPGSSIPRLSDPLPRVEGASTLQCFILLLFAYPMLGEIMRFAGNHIHFRGQRGRIEEKTSLLLSHLDYFEQRLSEFSEWLDTLAARVLGVVPTMSTFSPINYYVSIQFGVAQAAVFVQQILHDRYEKAQAAAAGMRPSSVFNSEDGSPKEDAHLGNLRVLWQKSAVFALVNARKLATLARRLSAGPHLESAGTEHRELRSIATLMARSETVEQGVEHSDERLKDWTWSRKCVEIGWLLDAIVRVGWSWGLNGISHAQILEIMEQMRPPGCPKFYRSFDNMRFPPLEAHQHQVEALHPTLQLHTFTPSAAAAYLAHRRSLLYDHWDGLSRETSNVRPLDVILADSEPLFSPPFKLVLSEGVEPNVAATADGPPAAESQRDLLFSAGGPLATPASGDPGFWGINDPMWSSLLQPADTLGDFIDRL